MAWGWSHTQEAYRDAEHNLSNLSNERIAVIWAEWNAADPGEYGGFEFNTRKYRREIRRAHSWIRRERRSEMLESIWEHAKDNATCDNGGWNAWLCPFGCGCHCVPFDCDNP